MINNKNSNSRSITIEDIEKKVEDSIYKTNTLNDILNAVKCILGELCENEKDSNSNLFKSVLHNVGQLFDLKNGKWNDNKELSLPAVFLHFTNIRYVAQQARVGEGRATLRIQYVLNRLNNNNEEIEGYDIFQYINTALQDGKNKYPALSERFNLIYFDHPESFADNLQLYVIDYEVCFRETSAYKYRNYVDRYLVVPPFTNHLDQLPENNPDNKENHSTPCYDEVSGFHLNRDNGK